MPLACRPDLGDPFPWGPPQPEDLPACHDTNVPSPSSPDPGGRTWGGGGGAALTSPSLPFSQHPHPSRSSALMLFSAARSAAASDELVCSSLCWARPGPVAPVLSGLGGGTGRGPSRGASLGPENASWVQATDTGLGAVPAETKRLACDSAEPDTVPAHTNLSPQALASYLLRAP